MSLSAPPNDCPPAYGGCTCACHRQPGIMHFAPCCRPSKLNMPTDPEWYREKAKLEEGSEISAGVPDAPAMVEPLNTKAWVMVPAEPTPAMVEAGWIDKEDVTPGEIWASMLLASPALPAVDGGEFTEQLLNQIEHVHLGIAARFPDITDATKELLRLSEDGAKLIQRQAHQIAALMNERTSLIETKREQIGRLTIQRDNLSSIVASGIDDVAGAALDDAESRVQSLEEEVKVLREALKPFAEYAPYVDMFVKGRAAQGGSPLLPTKHFRLSHFQAASAALKENGNG